MSGLHISPDSVLHDAERHKNLFSLPDGGSSATAKPRRKLFFHSSALSVLALVLQSCAPEAPSLGGASPVANTPAQGSAVPLSDARFNGMSLDDQYSVINKLYSTLYSGVPVEDFYSLDGGSVLTARNSSAPSLSSVKALLQQDLPPEVRSLHDQQIVGDEYALDDQGQSAPIEAAYYFDQNKPKQMPLARLFHYPLSRDAFSQWMSWHLANTILFSPAEEIDSADITDVQNLFRRLDLGIMGKQSVRAMVATHQNSVQNWRRFRSPEDNTREMMEIYLGIFDNDKEVPLASQACQDLYLTDESEGYKLAYTDYPNVEPVLVLNKYVVNCRDFYDVIASHPLLIPRVVSVLVDYFYTGHSVEERLSITQSISATNPITFEDIFLAILFSETYLLDTERARSFEESYLPMAKRLQWQAHPDLFKGIVGGRGSLSRTNMSEMGWPAMSLKLGRVASVPLDSLSFGNYHKALRETLMLDYRRWRNPLGVEQPGAPSPRPIEPLAQDATAKEIASHAAAVEEYQEAVDALSAEERNEYDIELAEYEQSLALYSKIDDLTVSQLVDYLFLSAAQRRASSVERFQLTKLFRENGHLDSEFDYAFARNGRLDDIAVITMDYLSRLPELYYMPRLR
ncbi:MAG: hypothetical protein AB8B79_17110 [Granulosicoccus sp.]